MKMASLPSAAGLMASGREAFDHAYAAAGGETVDVTMGDRPVRFCFAGRGISELIGRAIAATPAPERSAPC